MTMLLVTHVVISLMGILSGFAVMFGMLSRNPMGRWTAFFLATTAATSLTGFLFPIHGFTPAIGVGLISLVVLVFAIVARYPQHLQGNWRWIYIVTAIAAQYLNVFVLIVQSFQKISFLRNLAPTQSEPPFLVTQLIVLVAFVTLVIASSISFRVPPPKYPR